LLLNEKAVNAIVVETVPEWRNLVVADERQLGMQDGSAYIFGVHIGIIDLQNLLHNPAKIAKSAKLV
jgi:hypothetical protein